MKIIELDLLKENYGSEITLYDEQNNPHIFNLLLELSANNKHYAYFQSPEAQEGEIEVLRVIKNDNGEFEFELEYIDDDEWEEASEWFDLWTNKYE